MSGKTSVMGMGAIPDTGGSAFRVWAPNARRVAVKCTDLVTAQPGALRDWKSPPEAEKWPQPLVVSRCGGFSSSDSEFDSLD